MREPLIKVDIDLERGMRISELRERIIPTDHYIDRIEKRYARSVKKAIDRVHRQLYNNQIYKSFRKRSVYRGKLKFTKWIDLGEYMIIDKNGYKHIFNIDKGKIVLITIKNPTS